MRVLIINNTVIPARAYGGTERFVWWLGEALVALGHEVNYLVAPGSHCPFAAVHAYDPSRPLGEQIPPGIDVAHAFFPVRQSLDVPLLVTVCGNGQPGETFDRNSVFLTAEHARRHHAEHFVYIGLDPRDYDPVDLDAPRRHLLFLGKARWRVKNVRGARAIARRAGRPLHVVGGRGLPTRRVRYRGFLGGEPKRRELAGAAALVFPVRWPEPFGIAVIEALYCGLPVLGTPYGSLPELVTPEVGVLAADAPTLAAAARDLERFDRHACQARVREHFTAARMARDYAALYARVAAGEVLHPRAPHVAADAATPTTLLPFRMR